MTHPPVLTARRIISDFRSGSSLPVLVETTSGLRCVVKWKCTGEGPTANAVEWISLHLARIAGVPVPTTCLINITPDLLHDAQDPEINDLITRSVGVNLALEYIEGAVPFDVTRGDAVDRVMKDLIYQFDVLLLNIDRTDLNPNMLFANDKLCCIDWTTAMAIKMLVSGQVHSEHALLTQVRRHPFYVPANELAESVFLLDSAHVKEVVDSTPDEWLIDPAMVKGRVLFGLTKLLRESGTVMKRRLAALDTIPLESAEARKERTLRNRKAFEAKWGKF
ncbi:MAG: HipA family kinase [Bacteroidota bacterium]